MEYLYQLMLSPFTQFRDGKMAKSKGTYLHPSFPDASSPFLERISAP
jgi:hypothetical protein